ncbi:MAG: RagB/SusD family nutrient uptake outer membrane protein [Bacteroidaceae bacterium]
MKKTLYSLIAVSVVFALSSCNESRLDIPQKGVTNIEDFYQTDDDAQAALAAAYASFSTHVSGRGSGFIYTPYKFILNNGGDDMYAAGSNYGDNDFSSDLNDYNYDSGLGIINEFYRGIFESVYSANLVMDHFKDGTSAIQKQCVAEARALRAYDYFLLASLWGTPPVIEHTITLRDLPTNCDLDPDYNFSNKDLFMWIASEAEAAAAVLPERASKADKDGAVRCTKGFAQAVAGKAYIFAKEYGKAKDILKKVIDSGKYDLVANFEENFHVEGDGNAEKVFESNIEYNPGLGAWSGINQRSTWMEANIWSWRGDHFVDGAVPQQVYTGGADGWGGLGVPQWFGDEFFANDGHSQRFDATFKRVDDAVYNMTYSNPDLNTMSLAEKKASKDLGIKDVEWGLYGQSYWLAIKQMLKATDVDPAHYGNNVRLNNNVVMRYAEVLLLYAEACLQTGDAADAKIYINKIQERAGSATISATVDMNVLKKEKSYELWLEGSRMLDIKRWGDTDRIKQAGQFAPRLFDKLYRAPKASDEAVTWLPGEDATTGRFYTVNTHDAKEKWGDKLGFKENKNEYFPFPLDAINKNPNLRQNPGY